MSAERVRSHWGLVLPVFAQAPTIWKAENLRAVSDNHILIFLADLPDGIDDLVLKRRKIVLLPSWHGHVRRRDNERDAEQPHIILRPKDVLTDCAALPGTSTYRWYDPRQRA